MIKPAADKAGDWAEPWTLVWNYIGMTNVECRMMDSLRSVFLNRQNTLFDVRCWTFNVRRLLVSFLWSDWSLAASGCRSYETKLKYMDLDSYIRMNHEPHEKHENEKW